MYSQHWYIQPQVYSANPLNLTISSGHTSLMWMNLMYVKSILKFNILLNLTDNLTSVFFVELNGTDCTWNVIYFVFTNEHQVASRQWYSWYVVNYYPEQWWIQDFPLADVEFKQWPESVYICSVSGCPGGVIMTSSPGIHSSGYATSWHQDAIWRHSRRKWNGMIKTNETCKTFS